MILDAAQTAVSPSSPSVYTSTEPPSPSASRASVYPKSEKAHQILADLWSQEIEAEESIDEGYIFSRASPLITPECKNRISPVETDPPMLTPVWSLERISENDTAWLEAEESVDQVDGFSRASPLIRPEYKKEPQTMTSTEERDPPLLTPICSLERISESDTAHIEAEEPVDQEDIFYKASSLITPECEKKSQTLTSIEAADLPMLTPVWSLERVSESETVYTEAEVNQDIFSRALPSLAPAYETDPQPFTSTEELALPMIAAVGSQEIIAEDKTTHTEPEESDQQGNNFSGGSPVACELEPMMSTLLKTPQLTAPAAMQKETPGRATHLDRSHSSNKSPSSTALTSTVISAGTFSQPASLPATDVRPPTKRRKTNLSYWHFTKKSKFITTCNICKMDVTTEKIGGSDNVDIAALVSHLEHEHQFSQKVISSVLPATRSKIQDVERPSTTKRPSGTTSAASVSTTSPVTPSCLPSPSPADMKPGTKRRKRSFVWKYFTGKSKFIATCDICNMTVKIGKIGGCSNVGTAALITHLKRIHNITQEKAASSVLSAAVTKI